mmetsp:Transcript_64294/g.207128  ORF Transcript_64294/g.207128 Transcript_64294/m.207128 type:complete len:446 (+) Transcript_64294:173-1510(+)
MGAVREGMARATWRRRQATSLSGPSERRLSRLEAARSPGPASGRPGELPPRTTSTGHGGGCCGGAAVASADTPEAVAVGASGCASWRTSGDSARGCVSEPSSGISGVPSAARGASTEASAGSGASGSQAPGDAEASMGCQCGGSEPVRPGPLKASRGSLGSCSSGASALGVAAACAKLDSASVLASLERFPGDFCLRADGMHPGSSPAPNAAPAPPLQCLGDPAVRLPDVARGSSSRASGSLLPEERQVHRQSEPLLCLRVAECGRVTASAGSASVYLWSSREPPELACCTWPRGLSGVADSVSSSSKASKAVTAESAMELDLEIVMPSLALQLALLVIRLPPKRRVEKDTAVTERLDTAAGASGLCCGPSSPPPRGRSTMQPRSSSTCSWEKRLCFTRLCTRFLNFPPGPALLPGFSRRTTSCVVTSQLSDALGSSSCMACLPR